MNYSESAFISNLCLGFALSVIYDNGGINKTSFYMIFILYVR